MKKLIALLLAGCMMATMVVGCGSKEEAAEAPAVTEEAAEAVDRGKLSAWVSPMGR